MQLAAATAAKGTKRPTSGETCCRKDDSKSVVLGQLKTNAYLFFKVLWSPGCTETQAKRTFKACCLLLLWLHQDNAHFWDTLSA
jgi:hypothetical protein